MNEVFRLDNISYQYTPRQEALSGISFAIMQGEIFAIIGSNGCGKTTLLHLMSGLLFPTSGNICFNGNAITEGALKDVSFNRNFRESVGYVFQNSASQLFCPTVFDELIFGPLQMGMNKKMAFERAEAVMEMLNIGCLKERATYMLSGGEKKRVAIGAVLTTNPDVLLIDEPMSALDPKTRAFLIELIFQLNGAGKTIVLTTHHLELVDYLQPRVAVLSEEHRIEHIGASNEALMDTDLLIRANLISEHMHRHGEKIHKHLSTDFLFHKHS